MRSRCLAVATLLLVAQAAHAGGFYLTEVGTPESLGTAGAANVTQRAYDSAWANPAGLTGLDDSGWFGVS